MLICTGIMPPRRSTRGQKKEETESLTSTSSSAGHSLSTAHRPASQRLDEVDGPASAQAAKTSLSMKKKTSKKTDVLAKQQGDKKDGQDEKTETVHVLGKKSREAGRKSLPVENHHSSDQDMSKADQKLKPQRGRVEKKDKKQVSQNDNVKPGSKPKPLKKEAGQTKTVNAAAPRREGQKDISSSTSSQPKAHNTTTDSQLDVKKEQLSGTTTDQDVKPIIKVAFTGAVTADSSFTVTEDFSSSDSDFEEVSSQFRTPESSLPSSACSDSGFCLKLEVENSFSDSSHSKKMSPSMKCSDVSSESSKRKRDTPVTERRKDSSGSANKGKTSAKVSGKASKVVTTKSKVQTMKVKNVALKSGKSESQGTKAKFNKNVNKAEDGAIKEVTAATEDKKAVQKRSRKSETSQSQQTKAKCKNVDKNSSKREEDRASKKEKKKTDIEKKPSKAGDDKKKTGIPAEADDENDIMALLMKMEGQQSQTGQKMTTHADQPSTSGLTRTKGRKTARGKKSKTAAGRTAEADSTEESDWEEVEDYKHSPFKSQIPDAPVEITINDPTMIHKKRKKKEFDWKAYVQRRIKRLAREIQIEMHKVHLLCLLSGGMQQNKVCSDVNVCAMALSLVPASLLQKDVAFYDDQNLLFFLKWFCTAFSLSASPPAAVTKKKGALVSSSQLMQAIQDGSAGEARIVVMVLIAMLRAMGFNVRLLISLNPLPLKSSSTDVAKAATKRKTTEKVDIAHRFSKKRKYTPASKKTADGENPGHKSTKPAKNIPRKSAKGQSSKHDDKSGTKIASHVSKKDSSTKSSSDKSGTKRKRTAKAKKSADTSSSDDDDDDDDGPSVAKRRVSERARSVVKPSTSAKNTDDDDDDDEDYGSDGVSMSDGSDFSEEEAMMVRKEKRRKKNKGKGKVTEQSAVTAACEDDGSDGEFDTSFQVNSLLVRGKNSGKKANRQVLSDDSSEEGTVKSTGRDHWVEVYLPRQSKWICVDVVKCIVGKPYKISAAASSQPILYVLGFENDGSVKDVTARYAPQWFSHTKKRRVDSDWWDATLLPYTTRNTTLNNQEDRAIKDHLVQRPLPTNIADFKNHPLYALSRHLLKYEAIYPENSIPLGYMRKEPVYARECVHTLHSRDNWLREARLVRIGETPYKLVKSRKRWNRARENSEELDLELFGRWQTEDFIPPPAVNGKVPKNEYGNVELFKPSMLPGGTVHIRVPALNRVARKLGIDIAAAMTGWDHHCGYSHPVLDGWVVCEEHQEALMAAWEEDQQNQIQRELEKREKRVLNNWTALVRGLLIKDKLKKRFNLEEKAAAEVKVKKGKGKKGEKATDAQKAWPARQQHKQREQAQNPAPMPAHFTVETM